MTRPIKRLAAAFRLADGTASIEFVLIIPVVMAVFMAGFESGLLMTRHIMLERAVDMTMRELRLGHLVDPTHDSLKTEICSRTVVISDCENVIRIHLQTISTADWSLPSDEPTCVDRAEEITPDIALDPGSESDLMLVRVCVVVDAIFPTSGIGLRLQKDDQNGYGLVSVSAFVNEPS